MASENNINVQQLFKYASQNSGERSPMDVVDGIPTSVCQESYQIREDLARCAIDRKKKKLMDKAIERLYSDNLSGLSLFHTIQDIEDIWEKNPKFGTDQNIYRLAKLHYKVGHYYRATELLVMVQNKSAFPTIKEDFYKACFELMTLNNGHSLQIGFKKLQDHKDEFIRVPDDTEVDHTEDCNGKEHVKIDMSSVIEKLKPVDDIDVAICQPDFFAVVCAAIFVLGMCALSSASSLIGDDSDSGGILGAMHETDFYQ